MPPSPSAGHSGPPKQATGETRRSFFSKLGIAGLLAALAGQIAMLFRALMPNVLYEPPRVFKIGKPDQFPEGVTFLESQRVFVFRDQKQFHAISAECTHLGCTVKMVQLAQPKTVQIGGRAVQEMQEFDCPCHGSKYYGDGTNYAGPAPSPLAWYRMEIAADDGQLVVNLTDPVGQDFRLLV
jgi:menaquinol-cytochrome c reductase iron-sulfur subunit